MVRRFEAQQTTVIRELTGTMRKMEASSLKIDQGDLLNEDETEVSITFDRNGKRYIFKCSTYNNKLDNLRAAQLTISYLYRALETYGVNSQEESISNAIFDNFMLGFEATPDDGILKLTAGDQWYEILNVRPQATEQEIKNAYKALSKIYHPDNGGTKEDFIRLKDAYDKAINTLKEV